VVPLFGDVVIGPFNFVEKTANYDPQHWPRCLSAGASQQATILAHMSEYRQQHAELLCELMLLSDQRHKLIEVNSVVQLTSAETSRVLKTTPQERPSWRFCLANGNS